MELCKFIPDAPLYLLVEAFGRYSISDNKRCLRLDSCDAQCVGYDYTYEGVICDVFIKEKPHKAKWDGGIFVYGNSKCNNRTIPAPVAEWLDQAHGEYTTRKLQKVLDLVRESNEKKRWQKWHGQQVAELICNCFDLQAGITHEIRKQFKPFTNGCIEFGVKDV